jgi:dTDP-4-dehydrorhamnose 3,5-epimerase-like enzyme
METALSQVQWIELSTIEDDRGSLTAVESAQNIPIEIKRIFYMHHVKKDRGGHAHQNTDQVIVAISGSFSVKLSDGESERSFVLNDATRGLYVPRLIYTDLFDFSEGAVCMVLANTHYDMKMSLRSWEDYLSFIEKK